MTSTDRRGFLLLAALLIGASDALGSPPIEVLFRVWQDGTPVLTDQPDVTLNDDDTFEIVIRGPAGYWVTAHASAYIDSSSGAPQSFLDAMSARYPWATRRTAPIGWAWEDSVLPGSETLIEGNPFELHDAIDLALGDGSLATANAVRAVAQPVLVDPSGVAIDRTWDVDCESWRDFPFTSTSDWSPQDMWPRRLYADEFAPPGSSSTNTTRFSASLAFMDALYEQSGRNMTRMEAFLRDTEAGLAVVKSGGYAVSLSLQVAAVAKTSGPTPATTDSGTGGLTTSNGGMPTNTLEPLTVVMSPISTFRFSIGSPTGVGGPGYQLNATPIGPAADQNTLVLPLNGAYVPSVALVKKGAESFVLQGHIHDTRHVRYALPPVFQVGDTLTVQSIANLVGTTDTSGTSWSVLQIQPEPIE